MSFIESVLYGEDGSSGIRKRSGPMYVGDEDKALLPTIKRRDPWSCWSITRTIFVLLIGIAAAVALVLAIIAIGARHTHHDSFPKADLDTEVEDVLSTTMNQLIAGNPGLTPPDPHVVAGKETVVVVTNSLVSIYDKKTMQRTAGPIDGKDFFSSAGADHTLFADPYLLYDAIDERIWVVGFSFAPGFFFRIHLCVSKNASPRVASDFYCYKSDRPDPIIVDYIKPGVDADTVYLTSNDFNFIDGTLQSAIWVLSNKRDMINGIAPIDLDLDSNRYPLIAADPLGTVSTAGAFKWPAKAPFPRHSDAVKQTVFAGYRLDTDGGDSSDFSDDHIEIAYVRNPQTSPQIVKVEVPVPFFTLPVGDTLDQAPSYISPIAPEAPVGISQSAFPFDPVVSRNQLYFLHPVKEGDRIVLRWYQIDISKLITHNQATLVQFGTIDDGIHSMMWPSISVDKHDNVAFGFSVSSPYSYATPVYTFRLKHDPIGTVRFPLKELAPGDIYYQAVTGGSRNRYGDYSGLNVDPVDGETLWIFNQYTYRVEPTSRFTFGSAWNTKLGSFKIKKSGGNVPNSPQTQYFNGGSASDVHVTMARKPAKIRRRKNQSPKSGVYARMTPAEHHNKWLEKHIPHGEGCHVENGSIVCPPIQ